MSTRTEIIFTLALFYALTTLVITILGTYNINADPTVDSESVGRFGFESFITGLGIMGATFNTIFFSSLVVVIVWIIVTAFTGGGGS